MPSARNGDSAAAAPSPQAPHLLVYLIFCINMARLALPDLADQNESYRLQREREASARLVHRLLPPKRTRLSVEG